MDQQQLSTAKEFVRDLVDGQEVDSTFVVRERAYKESRRGERYLRLQLGDVTGSIAAMIWDEVEEIEPCCAPGTVVRALGRYSVHERYGPQLVVKAMRAASQAEYDPADLHQGPSTPVEKMAADLQALIDTVQRPHLRELLRRLLGPDTEIGSRWHEAPAAKYYHQAYRHGLLEHCLSVAEGVSAMAARFPGIDRDVSVTGALLHDVGKVEAYRATGDAIELTDHGKLLGEISIGYYMVRRAIEGIDGFTREDAQAVLHIILSHHGLLEHGSPVVPCTREATLVHTIDKLGGTLGSFDRLEKSLADGERWSGFDRGISGSAYFAPPAAESGREAA
ncbi:MAG: 3'-5' exoribonuclease YhaM family protein [Thermoleophilaceae bacterium]